MNNIKIVNDELRKRTDKNIVFDYDGKTFFMKNLYIIIMSKWKCNRALLLQ